MAVLKKYDLSGKELGEVSIEEGALSKEVNSQMVKDYLVAIRNNARQWSAHTKSRSEVAHSGQKPHPQKGTGRARQGYLGAPQYKGGGRVGTPRAKFDQHVSINKKEKKAAIRYLFSEKIEAQKIIVLESPEMREPKSKKVREFLQKQSLLGKRVLFLGESVSSKSSHRFVKSVRNFQKVDYMLLLNASGYDLARFETVVVLEPAVDQLLKVLKG